MGIFGKSKKEQVDELINQLEYLDKSDKNSHPYEWPYTELLKLEPRNRMVFFYKGKALINIEDYTEAINCFDQAIQIKPDSEVWWLRGYAYFMGGRNREEIQNSFNKAYELNPDDFKIIISISNCYAEMGEFDKAKMYLDHYLSKHPDDAFVWDEKGAMFEKCGEFNDANKCYEKAYSLNPKICQNRDEYLKRLEWIEEEVDSLIFCRSENIIDKNFCYYSSDSDTIYSNYFYSDTGKFFYVLTTDNFFLFTQPGTLDSLRFEREYGGQLSVPLEIIIKLKKMNDGWGNTNIISIKCDTGEEIYLGIIKGFTQFYNSLNDYILKKKDTVKKQQLQGVTVIDFSSIKEYLKNGGVVMQTFKCPGCGAALEFPDKVDITTCQYCGNKIKAVDLFEKIRTLI